jgi:Zn-dependent protease/CBS domain-containing protein
VSGLRVGRVAGVELSVNWSVLLLCAFLVWTLSASVFPATNPNLSRSAHIAMAVAATLGLLLALLLHELGHALAARREGMQTERITLWLFGGIARFKSAFQSAGAEFRVALAGPLVSLALGLLCVGLARLPAASAVNGVEAWLAYINLSLFVFNMLPALPLDGGRVLHALLWKVRGSLSWATRVAGRLGQFFGALMILAGGLLAVRGDVASGLWLVFIGWFLMAAARAEIAVAGAQRGLAGLHVSDVMVRHPVTVRSDETLGAVTDRVLSASPHTAYPVSDNSHPLGLLTARSVASVPRDSRAELRVRDRMIPVDEGLTVAADDDLIDAATTLLQTEVGEALVLRDGKLVGLLSLTDVTRVAERRGRRTAGRQR